MSEEMKGITCCGDCGYYNWKKHKCTRCQSIESNPRKHFYDDCPLPDVTEKKLEWINCDDRLPEDGVLVITLIYGHDVITVNEGETLKEALERISHYARTSVGFYSEEDGGWCTSDGYPEICTPRFWMPIPDPPEEGENT